MSRQLRSTSLRALLALAAVAAAPVRGAAVRLVVQSGSGTVGEDIGVPVAVAQPSGLGALEVEVVYDAAVLELKQVAEGKLLADGMLDHKVLGPGRVRCDLMSAKPIDAGGELFVLHFQAKAGAGRTEIRLENPQAWDHADILEMRVACEAGQLALDESASAPGRLPWIAAAAAGGLVVIVLAFVLGRRSSSRRS